MIPMRFGAARLLAFLVALLLLAAVLPARADTPVSLFLSFRGNVNFTGTEEVLRTKNNNDPCSLVRYGTVIYANLTGIPSGATILSAQLYWAGSGNTPDYTVNFDGYDVTAPTKSSTTINRQYTSRAYANNTYYNYFSGAADVTNIVKKKGNGYYSFSNLRVENGSPWCAVQGVVGGFALVVVYSHPNEPFRMLNLYEGFQDFQNTSLKIDLGDFNVPNPLPSSVTGRIGHITWEGDQTLSQGGEDLLFNGYEMTDKYPNSSTWFNPPGNQFNSASNVTGDSTSYGIDFDIYTLKSPVIQPGQRTATTTYRSGQDLVILSAEIVAMPYVANADLALAMVRNGDLTAGTQSSYTLTVTNGGIDDETGPVTVVDTLPAGLRLDSAAGTGWTCTNVKSSTKTVVTCTQDGPVKAKAKMTPIVIKVTPSAAGNYTNSATVSGKTGDDNSANNTATNSATAASATVAASLVLTREACKVNDIIDGEGSACHSFTGPVTAASTRTVIYITSFSTNAQGEKVASKLGTADYALPVEFKFTCAPGLFTEIVYGNTKFACNSANFVTLNAMLKAGEASAVVSDGSALSFMYADVGRVGMTMRYAGATNPAVNFISRPSYIGIEAVERVSDGYADQQGISPNWAKPDIGFAKAGEPFTMRICARMVNGNCAPSFGFEPEAEDFEFKLDVFAVNLSGTPRLPIVSGTRNEDGEKIVDVQKIVSDAWLLEKQPDSDTEFVRGTGGYSNMYIATARWFEAGMLGITPRLTNYLATGQVGTDGGGGAAAARMSAGTRVVGRFYPDHFETSATSKLDCLAPMNCPVTPGAEVEGAVYSTQPFEFGIKAYGLPRDGAPSPLSLYQNQIIDTLKPRPLTLTASKTPSQAEAPALGAFTAPTGTQLTPPKAVNDYPEQKGLVAWTLGPPYDPAKRTVATWGAPTPVYLRASMKEFRGSKAGYTEETITSQTPAGAPAGSKYEDGLVVVAGRLYVDNVFGSELLRLPVPLAAQYWSGSAWSPSRNDDNVVASAVKPLSCTKAFAKNGVSGACASILQFVGSVGPVPLKGGKGILSLPSAPRGTRGSVDFTVDSSEAPWLPSTQARATFGLYRSPLIYLREVY